MKQEKWIEVIKEIKMDDSMKQRLVNNCSKKKYSSTLLFKYPKIVWVASIAVCVLISVPVIASVTSTVLERMQLMSKEEVKYLNEMVQSQTSEADSFSRKLTEDEIMRKKELLQEYTYKAKSPISRIALIDGEDQKLSKELCYNVENSIFYLPERDLTDEELLQIIEFNEKRDYSLQVMNEVDKIVVDMGTVEDMGIMERAKYMINTIYGVTTENMKNTIEYDENTGQYDVTFIEETREFSLRINDKDLKVSSISADLQKQLSSYSVVTKEIAENEKVLYEKSIDILDNILNVNQEVKSAWCNYFIGDGGRGQDRKLHYLFELEDGSGYIFRYAKEEGTLYEFIYMNNFSNYKTMMNQNDSKDLERGIIREEFEISLEK